MVDVDPCAECGQRHVRMVRVWNHGTREMPTCGGHVFTDRSTYVKGQNRKKLDKPRPCGSQRPIESDPDWKCHVHGGSAGQVKAKRERDAAEQKATAAVLRRLGDSGETVTDPIAKLCSIAGRAVAFMEALGARVDDLAEADRDNARAEIALYGRAIKDAAGVVESIIRMGIAERLAKAEEQQTAAIIAFIDGVLTDLGHNPRDPEVAGVITRRLELVS